MSSLPAAPPGQPGGIGRKSAAPSILSDLAHAALLIVDMQNYGANPASDRGRLMKARAPAEAESYFKHLQDIVIPNQLKLLSFCRESGVRVVYATAGAFLADGADMTARRRRRDEERMPALGHVEHMHPGTTDYQIIEALRPAPNEIVIAKNSIDAFCSSPIDQLLRNMSVRDLVIVGVITEGCVESTARGAADRGYNCVVVEDGCASDAGVAAHEASLRAFARLFGEVATTDDVLARFKAVPPID